MAPRQDVLDRMGDDVEGGHRQRECPQQRGAAVLPRLCIDGKGAGIVVPDRDDEAWSKDREEGPEARPPAAARCAVVVEDGAARTSDGAQMGLVEVRAPQRLICTISI
jgi:hypothetical protein